MKSFHLQPLATKRRFDRRKLVEATLAGAGASLLHPGREDVRAMPPHRSRLAAPLLRRPAEQMLTGDVGASRYHIEIPSNWNGSLILAINQIPNTLEFGDQPTRAALLADGYALAATQLGWQPRPWPVSEAMTEQIALLDLFDSKVGAPDRTIAWGTSLPGMVSAALVARQPLRFAGVLTMGSTMMGSVAYLNTMFDSLFTIKTLLAAEDPTFILGDFSVPEATIVRIQEIVSKAQQTAEGRARFALAAGFGQIANWYGVTASPPEATTNLVQQKSLAEWYLTFVLDHAIRDWHGAATRVAGNPVFNNGVVYRDLFSRAAHRPLIESLYADAKLDLDADLAALDDAPRITAEPTALDALRHAAIFDGWPGVPILTMHETGDGLASVAAEHAFADVVSAAGNESLLRQTYIERASHVRFTPAEQLAAFAQLVARIDDGAWNDEALTPHALNMAAQKLDPALNWLRQEYPAPYDGPLGPSFIPFQPDPLPRPFDARTNNPAPASLGAA